MDKDVSKLTDEELDARIAGEEPASPESAEESPKDKETPVVEPEEKPAEETQPEETQEEVNDEEPEEKSPSRRETLRVTQLLKKYPNLREQPPEAPSNPEALNYQETLDADPELIKRLEADRDTVGKSQFQAGAQSTRAEIRSAQWETLLHIDAPVTEAKYPWLNPKDSENFSPAHADAINEEYKALVGYNEQTGMVSRPEIRYSDFVDARVEQARDLARTMTADTTKNIAKQAATTGIRPDGSSAKRMNLNKPAYQMSDEELDAKLKQNGLGTN